MNKINVLIAGATGYIGISLVKILIKHKYVNIKYLCGNTSVGKKISYFDNSIKNLKLPKIVKFKKSYLKEIEVIFTALPNGDAQLISKNLNDHNKLIDLSGDFRLENKKIYSLWYKRKHSAPNNIKKSIYSLPEIINNKIKDYSIISCPGCYPTSILLPLIPLIKNNLINIKNIVIDSKSGYSGGGRLIKKKFKNIDIDNTISSYGIKLHRHNPEIEQELNKVSKKKINFTFAPHLTPMFRGILTNIYLDTKSKVNVNKILNCLKYSYRNSHFISIFKNKLLSTSQVINTNKCFISVCETNDKNKIIILSTIDNLIKGGAGQAVQNFNILYNLKINEGLS